MLQIGGLINLPIFSENINCYDSLNTVENIKLMVENTKVNVDNNKKISTHQKILPKKHL